MSSAAPLAPWDIVKVPFPYVDRPIRQRRPALLISVDERLTSHHVAWVLMITAAAHRRWPFDVEVSDLGSAGLPAPSVVRCAKVATVDRRDLAPLGRLARPDQVLVASQVRALLSSLVETR